MISFDIPTMSCNHCVRAITEAVHSVDAQADVQVSLPEHRVQVDSSASREQLAAALKEAGYAPA